jgi:hypothetical protein
MRTFINEYETKFYLIAIKRVYGKLTEFKFQEYLKLCYPEHIEHVNVNGKNKPGMYKFDLKILNDFNCIPEL